MWTSFPRLVRIRRSYTFDIPGLHCPSFASLFLTRPNRKALYEAANLFFFVSSHSFIGILILLFSCYILGAGSHIPPAACADQFKRVCFSVFALQTHHAHFRSTPNLVIYPYQHTSQRERSEYNITTAASDNSYSSRSLHAILESRIALWTSLPHLNLGMLPAGVDICMCTLLADHFPLITLYS